jgi:Na+-driven multidrug efflux pump
MTTRQQMLEARATCLRTVGPFYGMFGFALSLYFASPGAGRLLWPLLGTAARLAIPTLVGWLALRRTGELSHVFLAQSLGLISSGFINVAAVAGGAWFGSLTWPWSTAAALQRRWSI